MGGPATFSRDTKTTSGKKNPNHEYNNNNSFSDRNVFVLMWANCYQHFRLSTRIKASQESRIKVQSLVFSWHAIKKRLQMKIKDS